MQINPVKVENKYEIISQDCKVFARHKSKILSPSYRITAGMLYKQTWEFHYVNCVIMRRILFALASSNLRGRLGSFASYIFTYSQISWGNKVIKLYGQRVAQFPFKKPDLSAD